MKKFKRFISKIKGIKNYITEDFIVTFITFLVSVVLELIKQINMAANSAETINCEVISNALRNFLTWRPIINVALITAIVWFIIGISKLLNKRNGGKRALIFTMIVFIVAVSAIVWYVIEAVYPANEFTTVCGILLAGVLFLLLVIFLADKNIERPQNSDTNHIIAAEPHKV